MDPANGREAILECQLDESEGADIKDTSWLGVAPETRGELIG